MNTIGLRNINYIQNNPIPFLKFFLSVITIKWDEVNSFLNHIKTA